MTNLSDNTRGVILMMASMAFFTLNDACMKAAGEELPLFQAILIRGVLTSLLLLALARAMGGLRTERRAGQFHEFALRIETPRAEPPAVQEILDPVVCETAQRPVAGHPARVFRECRSRRRHAQTLPLNSC